jgi:phosphonate transport system permease protein
MTAQRLRSAAGWVARRLVDAGRLGIALAKRAIRRLAVFLIDAVFLAYLVVMGSYIVTRIASGIGEYVAIPGGFVVLSVVAAAALWGSLGVSVGERLLRFLSGRPGTPPEGKVRRQFSPAAADGRRQTGVSLEVHGRTGARTSEASALQRTPWYRTLWGWSLAIALLVTVVAATVITDVDFSRLRLGFPGAMKIVRSLVHPDWSILGDVIRYTIVTLFMGLMATLLAIPVAAALSFLAARNLTRGPVGRFVYTLVRALVSITRAVEPIVWAIVFAIWVRMGPFAGTLALFICSIADLTKLYSEQLESIDPGPPEAITAVGGRRLQVLVYGIVPQIINPYLSFTFYRWDINVRMGTIIGMVGGGGIGMQLMQYVRVGNAWEEVGTCILAIIVVVWALDALSARSRARLA